VGSGPTPLRRQDSGRSYLPAAKKPQFLSSPDAEFLRPGVRTLGLAASQGKNTIHGGVADDGVEPLGRAGYTDGEVGETLANAALNLFSNDFNHVAATEPDFSAAPDLAA
jgi:hypothetical protein